MKVDAKKVFKLQEGLIMSKIEINDSGGGEIDWRIYFAPYGEKKTLLEGHNCNDVNKLSDLIDMLTRMKEIIEKKGMIEDNEKQYIPDDCPAYERC